MHRLRAFLGLLAAIFLVIGGVPASASTNLCNPCPPDCPMMAQMADAAANPQMPGKSGNAGSPCKSVVVCQSAFAVVLFAHTTVETVLLTETAEHDFIRVLVAPSRPPDPTLRPPKQL